MISFLCTTTTTTDAYVLYGYNSVVVYHQGLSKCAVTMLLPWFYSLNGTLNIATQFLICERLQQLDL